ncbi:hypothetical protein [Streptomyces sirii]|uniref:hypothetical protein n=1 Tax=Streptomyces sirii TaxID=3127701 RepID=UPI003D35F8D5
MVRNVLGSLIALVGATAAVWSPFRPWYDGRHGRDIRIEDLFDGITPDSAPLFGSVLLPMAFAALLTLIGVALRSRLLVALAGLVVLGFTILWMVRQGQAANELTAGARGLGVGVANALGGGALILLGALIMRGRERAGYGRGADRRHDERRYDDGYYDDRPYDDGYYGGYGPDAPYDRRRPAQPAAYPRGRPNRGTRAARARRSGTRNRTSRDRPDRLRAAPAARTANRATPRPPPCRSPSRPRPNGNGGPSLRSPGSNGPRNRPGNSPRSHRRPCRPVGCRPRPRWNGAGSTAARSLNSRGSPRNQSRTSLNRPRRNGSRARGDGRRASPHHVRRASHSATPGAPAPSPWPRPARTRSGPCCTRRRLRRRPPASR